jgi:hypothetical protein
VSEDFLNSVSLVIYDVAPFWDTNCWEYAAYASGNTITFCSADYYDPNNVNPYLVHELVHVHQQQEDGLFVVRYYWEYLTVGYENISYEIAAYDCGDLVWQTYNAGQDLPPLSVAPCNLP